MQISLYIPAIPIAQPRQRHRISGAGARQFVQNYTPSESPVADYKATVRHAARENYHGAPIEGPLAVRMTFVFARPGRLIWKKRPMPRVPHVGPKDCDNLAKSTLDALNKIVFADDGQIWQLECRKLYAAGDEQPHVEMVIFETDTMFDPNARLELLDTSNPNRQLSFIGNIEP